MEALHLLVEQTQQAGEVGMLSAPNSQQVIHACLHDPFCLAHSQVTSMSRFDLAQI
jgi:hypothetical protein